MKLRILFIALLMTSISWAQTIIYTSTCAALSPPWTYNNVNIVQPIQQSGYWLLEDNDSIVSEAFDVSSYTSGLSLDFEVGTYGSGSPNVPAFVEYSLDNGVTWSTTTFTSATPTSATLIASGTFTIPASSATQFRLRFNKGIVGGRQGVRIDNITLTGLLPCTVPLNQASGIAFSNPTLNGATISWTNGASTSGSMVVIRPVLAAAVDPSTSTSYTANSNYATAGQIDTNNRVVYLAAGTSVTVSGLAAQTQYTATIYSYNAVDCYNITAPVSVNFYTLSTEPTAHPATFSCSLGTPTTSVLNLTFPQANLIGALGYIILYRIGFAPTGVPVDGAFYPAGTVFGDATVLGQTSLSGTDTTFAATGLNSGTAYYFSLVPFNSYLSTPGTINYRTSATIRTSNCATSVATPVITIANNGTQVTAANVPQGTTNLILSKIQLAVTTANANLTGITVNTSGTYVASDLVNLKVRYSADAILDAGDLTLSTKTATLGTGPPHVFPAFTPQIITAATTGYIFITADISATAVLNNTIALNAITTANITFTSGTKGGTTTAGGLQTIVPSAPAVPTAFTRVCTSNSTQSLTWAAPATGTFDGYLLVVRDAGVPNAVTSIVASSQTFNTNYSLAPTYNATTSRVLYIGTGASATISGLTPGATYTYALYSYKNNGASSIYSATATTITQTAAVPNVTAAGSSPGNATGTITWTNPTAACYDSVIAVVTTAQGITFTPSGNGSAYVPNTVYAGPNQVVFNTTGSFVAITGLTNGVTYYVEIFVKIGTEWSSGVEVSVTPALATVFKPGELLFVGFDGQYLSSGANDQYMVATLVDILPGTSFSIANSRYEAGAAANLRTDKWGGPGDDPSTAPGTTNFTYNGPGNITAGSVLVLNTNGSNVFSYMGVITGTTLTDRSSSFTTTQPFGLGTAPNISATNGDGEQIYLLQGSFISDGIIDTNEANYVLAGTLLHGFTIKTGWVPLTTACSGVNGGGSNRQSRLPNALTCFNVESAVANTISGYYRNSAEHGPTSIRNIIKAVANVTTNWVITNSRYTIDATSSATNRAGKTFIIGVSDNAGQWIGDTDTNWFNCGNWGRLSVPDATVDVTVDSVISQRDAVVDYTALYSSIYSGIALCKNLTISGRKVQLEANTNNKLEVHGNLLINNTGVLDMDDSNNATADGNLYLYENYTNSLTSASFLEGNGTVNFVGSVPQIINTNTHTNPEIFYNVILDNNFSTATSNNIIALGNLEVKLNRLLTIGSSTYPNDYIRINNRLTNNGGIVIESGGQLIQVNDTDSNDGDYSGTKFTVKREYTAKDIDYVYWSAPTKLFPVANIPNGYRYEWNPVYANANGTFGTWRAPSTPTMTNGKGYIARTFNGSDTPATNTFSFTGQPNNGLITIPISRWNVQGPEVLAYPLTGNTTKWDDNWNLVGNPYPSAINSLTFLSALNNPDIEGFVYVWSHGTEPSAAIADPFYNDFVINYTSADYIIYNGTGTVEGPTGFNGKIAAGQGFFVLMKDGPSATSSVTFNNSMRSDAGSSLAPYNNTQFYRYESAQRTTVGNEEKSRIWLEIVTPQNTSKRTLIGYVETASNENDRLFDAVTKPNSLDIYSYIDTDLVQEYCIQGRALPFSDTDTVKLGIKVSSSGAYKIAIAAVDGLFSGTSQNIYLEDKVLGIIHDLRQNPYTFNTTTGVYNDRFVLRYTNSTLENPDFETLQNSLIVAGNNGEMTIKSAIETIQEVTVYDILGRQLLESKNIGNNNFVASNISMSQQALIVKIKLVNGLIVKRKIIL